MCSDARHWPQTDRVWRQFGQLDLVMERTGVDPVFAARKARGMAVAQARNICLVCLYQKQCRSLLDHDERTPSWPSAPMRTFSINAGDAGLADPEHKRDR